MQELETLQLPADVLKRIEARVDRTEFEDTAEYVTHILEEVLFEVEGQVESSENGTVDEQQVKERLESLGYLNE